MAITVVYTTSHETVPSACASIHPNAPDRALQGLALGLTTVFLNLATSDDISHFAKRLLSILPISCRYETMHLDIDKNIPVHLIVHKSQVRDRLEAIITDVSEELKSSSTEFDRQTIIPKDFYEYDQVLAPQSVVDWTVYDQVLTTVHPVDSFPIFSSTKTCWLAGLSGSLGLSLCRWMVLHGARYVVISRRAPISKNLG